MNNSNLRTALNPEANIAADQQEQQAQDQMQQQTDIGDEQQQLDTENADETRDEGIQDAADTDSPSMDAEPPFLEPLDQEDEVPPFLQPVIDRSPKELPPESYAHWGIRQSARVGFRIGEAITGALGDSREAKDAFINTMGSIFKNAAKAFVAPKVDELLGEGTYETGEKGAEKILSGLNNYYDWATDLTDPGKKIREKAPTSKDVRNFIKEYTGEEWTEPKNDWERFGDNLATTTTELLLTPSGRANVARKIGWAALQAGGGEVVKEAFKAGGFGETSQELAKAGMMVAIGLAGEANVKDFADALWGTTRESIPAGQTYNFGGSMPELASISRTARRSGGPTPGEGKVRTFVENIYRDLRKDRGFLPPNEVVEARKKLNLMRFSSEMDHKGRQMLDKVDNVLHGELQKYGTSVNPTFWGNYTKARAATKGIEQTKRASNLINKYVDKNQFQSKVLTTIGGGAAGYAGAVISGAAPSVLPTAAATLGGASFAIGIRTLERFFRHPVLRSHYLSILRNSSMKTSGAFVKSLKKLNDNYEKIYGDEDKDMPDFLEPLY